jgi:prevent-host-death family protein
VKIGTEAARPILAELCRRAAAGEEVIITRRGRPLARLVPVEPAPTPYRVMAPLLPAYADEPADPAIWAQALIRAGSLLGRLNALAERLTADALVRERACPSTLLALLPNPPESR